jgi:hypothetical protein
LDAVGPVFVFFGGILLAVFCFWRVLRRTRKWIVAVDADAYPRQRAERRERPRRYRWKRLALHVSVWVPSAIAAVVAFDFPLATHLLYPGTHHLEHYLVPIPENLAVFQVGGKFVVAFANKDNHWQIYTSPHYLPIWTVMNFVETEHDAVRRETVGPRSDFQWITTRAFAVGDSTAGCWESPTETLSWFAQCETVPVPGGSGIEAKFRGRKEDIPKFYQVVQGIRRVE